MDLIIIQFNSLFIYVHTQQLKSQLWSKYEPKKNTKRTYAHEQKTKQDNLNHLDNNKNLVYTLTPTIVWWYVCVC
jgi:hypothetical protein